MILVHQKLILLTAFTAALLAFLKIKSHYAVFSSRALRLMSYGCLLLIFGSMVGLIGSSGILGPGYSQSLVYFFLESIVGYITGWILLIWGMAGWLPYLFSLSNRLHNETRHTKLYESIMKISSYGDASPATFNKIALTLMQHYNFQAASLHIPDRAGRLSLFAASGLPKQSRNLIRAVKNTIYNKVYESGEAYQADETFKIHRRIAFNSESGPIVDALSIPVEFGAKRIGVMTVYTNHARVFNQNELKALDAIGVSLALAFYRDGLQKTVNANRSFKDFIAVILKTSRSEDNFNTRVIRLAKLLKMYMKFNFMRLYLLSDGAPQSLDFDLAGGSRLIVEKGFLSGDNYKPVRWVIAHKRSLVLPDESMLFANAWQLPEDSKILFIPVVVNGDVVGVLAVAMARVHKIKHNDKVVFEAISAVISSSLLEEMNEAVNQDAFDRIGAIKYSVETALTPAPSNLIYDELARVIVEKTPATFCRIMLMNPERNKFLTAAIYQRRELKWKGNTGGGLPISELHLHQKVISTGKPVLIRQFDSKLKVSASERQLLWPEGISQCLLNPIIIDGKTQGVVIIGENRRPERSQIGSNETVFTMLLTNVISMLLQNNARLLKQRKLTNSNRLAIKKLTGLKNSAQTLGIVDGFNSRLNGPLAGILASCEFMKASQELPREQLEKYLNVIDRNAKRIHKLSGQFAEARRSVETAHKP